MATTTVVIWADGVSGNCSCNSIQGPRSQGDQLKCNNARARVQQEKGAAEGSKRRRINEQENSPPPGRDREPCGVTIDLFQPLNPYTEEEEDNSCTYFTANTSLHLKTPRFAMTRKRLVLLIHCNKISEDNDVRAINYVDLIKDKPKMSLPPPWNKS